MLEKPAEELEQLTVLLFLSDLLWFPKLFGAFSAELCQEQLLSPLVIFQVGRQQFLRVLVQ